MKESQEEDDLKINHVSMLEFSTFIEKKLAYQEPNNNNIETIIKSQVKMQHKKLNHNFTPKTPGNNTF